MAGRERVRDAGIVGSADRRHMTSHPDVSPKAWALRHEPLLDDVWSLPDSLAFLERAPGEPAELDVAPAGIVP